MGVNVAAHTGHILLGNALPRLKGALDNYFGVLFYREL